MLKVYMSQSFLFPYAKELLKINDEEWCLFLIYCDSTLGCPVIQDFVLCGLENVVKSGRAEEIRLSLCRTETL